MSYDNDDQLWDRMKFALAIIVAILVIGWLLVAPPESICDPCPPGSRSRVVRGYFGPSCICEVSR